MHRGRKRAFKCTMITCERQFSHSAEVPPTVREDIFMPIISSFYYDSSQKCIITTYFNEARPKGGEGRKLGSKVKFY